LVATKNNEAAATAFQTAFQLQPESVVSLNSLAELHASAGQSEQAIRTFREVLRRKPYWGPAHFGLGKVLDAMGRSEEANTEFAAAFRYRLRTPTYYKALGALALTKGWYERAVENYTDSLRLFPADAEVQFGLARSLVKLHRNAEGLEHYREALRLRPDFLEARFCLGLELGQSGDAVGAAAAFREAIRIKPDFAEAHLNLGIALLQQQLHQEAREQFEETLRLAPGNQTAQKYMASLRASHPAPEAP